VDLYKQNMIEKYGKPEEEENAGEASDPNNIPNETP
jgi:hypothetical protein